LFRCRNRRHPTRVDAQKVFGSVLNGATQHVLAKLDELLFVDPKEREFERISSGVVIPVALGRRSQDGVKGR
jgi:hypothetical protein